MVKLCNIYAHSIDLYSASDLGLNIVSLNTCSADLYWVNWGAPVNLWPRNFVAETFALGQNFLSYFISFSLFRTLYEYNEASILFIIHTLDVRL